MGKEGQGNGDPGSEKDASSRPNTPSSCPERSSRRNVPKYVCAVGSCPNDEKTIGKNGSPVHFFEIPPSDGGKGRKIRKMWEDAIPGIRDAALPAYRRVCEDHFPDGHPTPAHPAPELKLEDSEAPQFLSLSKEKLEAKREARKRKHSQVSSNGQSVETMDLQHNKISREQGKIERKLVIGKEKSKSPVDTRPPAESGEGKKIESRSGCLALKGPSSAEKGAPGSERRAGSHAEMCIKCSMALPTMKRSLGRLESRLDTMVTMMRTIFLQQTGVIPKLHPTPQSASSAATKIVASTASCSTPSTAEELVKTVLSDPLPEDDHASLPQKASPVQSSQSQRKADTPRSGPLTLSVTTHTKYGDKTKILQVPNDIVQKPLPVVPPRGIPMRRVVLPPGIRVVKSSTPLVSAAPAASFTSNQRKPVRILLKKSGNSIAIKEFGTPSTVEAVKAAQAKNAAPKTESVNKPSANDTESPTPSNGGKRKSQEVSLAQPKVLKISRLTPILAKKDTPISKMPNSVAKTSITPATTAEDPPAAPKPQNGTARANVAKEAEAQSQDAGHTRLECIAEQLADDGLLKSLGKHDIEPSSVDPAGHGHVYIKTPPEIVKADPLKTKKLGKFGVSIQAYANSFMLQGVGKFPKVEKIIDEGSSLG